MQKSQVAVAVVLGLGTFAQLAGADPRLGQPCPVDWRAVPLAEAVRDLAERLDVPYILDSSVSDEHMTRPVRLAAVHLNGRQAFRWTVRLAGLEAVLVDGAIMIAHPDRLPRAWRLSGTIGAARGGEVEGGGVRARGGELGEAAAKPARVEGIGSGVRITPSDPRWEQAASRRADLAWVDTPLSRVARDISDRFGIDIVFHAAILDDQPLVRLEAEGVDLAGVSRALEEQLKAVSGYDDGVIWVRPPEAVTSQPAAQERSATGETAMAALASEAPISVLSRPVEISIEAGGPHDLGVAIGRAAGLECRAEGVAEGKVAPVSARGSLLEVLEAGSMLEGWKWKIGPSAESKRPILLIRTEGSGRSVP